MGFDRRDANLRKMGLHKREGSIKELKECVLNRIKRIN